MHTKGCVNMPSLLSISVRSGLAVVLLVTMWSVMPMPVARATIFAVKTTADTLDANVGDGLCADSNGDCSLRAAIQEANALSGDDTITVPAGTYLLTVAGAGEDDAASGDLDIRDSLTIIGGGSDSTVVDGNQLDRVLQVHNGVIVKIDGVLISNGRTPSGVGGGGIWNDGALALSNSIVSDNSTADVDQSTAGAQSPNGDAWAISGGSGGGIYNTGTLALSGSTVRDNRTGDGGHAPQCDVVGGCGGWQFAGAGGYGGGIYNGGTAALDSSAVSGNTTGDGGDTRNSFAFGGLTDVGGRGGAGGGIFNRGRLTLTDSIVGDNVAGSGGVNGNYGDSGWGGYGGGIANAGALAVTHCIIRDNTAGHGGAITSDCGGSAGDGGDGGGIYSGDEPLGPFFPLMVASGVNEVTATVYQSTLKGNTAGDGGLAYGIQAGDGGDGGGIYTTGTLALSESTVRDSVTGTGGNNLMDPDCGDGGSGGGIYNDGTLTLDQASVRINATGGGGWADGPTCDGGSGGGVYNRDTVTLSRSCVWGNSTGTGGHGGGLANNGALTLHNSTVSGNSANGGGDGGGIHSAGTLTLNQGTIAGNGGNLGDGLYVASGDAAAKSTILGPNHGPDCQTDGGSVASHGHNLVQEPGNCDFSSTRGDIIGQDPLLGPLQHNGGNTQTRALLPGSPAIDAGSCTDIAGQPVTGDQRGEARPQGRTCDIGAYEFARPVAEHRVFLPLIGRGQR